jgi:two-component system response regulator RegX3
MLRPKVLLVDHDRELIDLLTYSLRRAGMDVSAVLDGAAALSQFDAWQPDLVLLDITPGGAVGLDIVTRLRGRSDVPIVIVSTLRSEDDKVRAFGLGADDYVTRPLSYSELIARIRVQLRLAGHRWSAPDWHTEFLQSGSLTLDMTEHMVERAGRSVALTRMEFRLLACLMAQANSVVPIDAIIRSLWARDDDKSKSKASLQVLVHRLRRKLEDDPAQPTLMLTVPGVGLCLASATVANAD